uniref:L1 transposable element RRM domain-containing protein n=1 Tax=Amphilophus citrinellus TaxID=61819 RepID=A0A3Q0SYH9_AMPCI
MEKLQLAQKSNNRTLLRCSHGQRMLKSQVGWGGASSGASNEAILAAVTAQGAQVAKLFELIDDLKKSIEGRLDIIESSLATMQKEQREIESRVDVIDEAMSSTDSRISALEVTCGQLREENALLKVKLNDLEGRSRRCNIRVLGIKEGEEQGRPTDFITRLIPEVLGKDNFAKPVKIDRAHRSLRPKPQPDERPRAIIARIHNARDVANILRLSRLHSPLMYNGARVSIFPDYTAEVVSQRMAYNNVRKKLTEAGAKCSLPYPAKLQVVHNNTVKTFLSPAEADLFASSISVITSA